MTKAGFTKDSLLETYPELQGMLARYPDLLDYLISIDRGLEKYPEFLDDNGPLGSFGALTCNNMLYHLQRQGYPYSDDVKLFEKFFKEMLEPENLAFYDVWSSSGGYCFERREIAKICAFYWGQYHLQTYLRLASLVEEERELSWWEYHRLCQNEESVKILKAHWAKARFKEGDRLELKANIKGHAYRHAYLLESASRSYSSKLSELKGIPLTVLEVAPLPPLSPTKGAKTYKVLPEDGEPLIVEERNLKKRKK